MTIMLKFEHIREEDYWLFPIVLFNVIFGVVAIYASVPMFRVPGIVLYCLGLWFTSAKIRRSYSAGRARIHIGLTILLVLIATLVAYLLTN